MRIIEHSMPILPGENDFPKADDERFRLFWEHLIVGEIMDAEGIMLKPAKLRRGMNAHGWLVRLEIEGE